MNKTLFSLGLMLTIAVAQVTQAGTVLTDSHGTTVYTYDLDQGSESKCYNTCAITWPPVRTLGEEPAGVGVTKRTDGTSQITFRGQPLYYYVGDSAPGETNGDGIDGIWHIIKTN